MSTTICPRAKQCLDMYFIRRPETLNIERKYREMLVRELINQRNRSSTRTHRNSMQMCISSEGKMEFFFYWKSNSTQPRASSAYIAVTYKYQLNWRLKKQPKEQETKKKNSFTFSRVVVLPKYHISHIHLFICISNFRGSFSMDISL